MTPFIKKISSILYFRHIPIKLFYFISSFSSIYLFPHIYFRKVFKLQNYCDQDQKYIENRVNYYIKKNTKFTPSKKALQINQIKRKDHSSSYFLDTVNVLKYFNPNNKLDFTFGDIITLQNTPSIVKSRPINANNENNVLLKLNKVRHFNFINDWIPFEEKKSILVARGNVFSFHQNRLLLLQQFFNNPLFNIGSVNLNEDQTEGRWIKPKMSIEAQLHYKFVYCWEGNDVATNLKWVMSSNSISVMPTPKYETWFMEGQLIPNVHYIHIKDDLSDLEYKINYYSTHIEEAKEIIKNANAFVRQFKNRSRENFIQLKVMQKYFSHSQQN